MARTVSMTPDYGSNQSPDKLGGSNYSGASQRNRVLSRPAAVSGMGVAPGRTGVNDNASYEEKDDMGLESGNLQAGGLRQEGGEGFSDSLSPKGMSTNQPEIVRERLFRAIGKSYRDLERYRNMNRELVRNYSGAGYDNSGPSAAPKQVRYLDLLNQAVDAYQTLLAANRPRVMVTTKLPQYRAFANHFAHAVNTMIKEIRLEETLRHWVLDAFFCVRVVKTHVASSGLVEIEPDFWMDPGTPFASNVALDDFVYDTSAKKWSEVKYAGDMYRIAFSEAVELFGEEAMSGHTPSSKGSLDEERVQQISRGEETDEDEFEPMIDIADIWIPRLGVIESYVVDSRSQFTLKGEPLAVEEWTGGEEGPYHILGFNDVPENIMPTSPASHLESLENLINNVMRKNARQAKRQKDIHVYTPAGAESARQIQRADDGEWVQVNSTDDIGMMKQGGVDQSNYAFMLGGIELFDRMAGNLQAIMGLGSQADTVGQEKLIHGAASKKEGQMQYVMLNAATKLLKQLGKMLWQDEFKTLSMEITVPGAPGYSVQDEWKPGDREGNFLDYNFEIDVYSMQFQSPGSKVQQLNQLVMQVFLPMTQLMMQQGGTIDMMQLTKTYAELMNLPELENIIRFSTPMPEGDSPSSAIASVPKSPMSTRNYVRHNTGGQGSNPLQQSMQMMAQGGAGSGGGSGAGMFGPKTAGGMT